MVLRVSLSLSNAVRVFEKIKPLFYLCIPSHTEGNSTADSDAADSWNRLTSQESRPPDIRFFAAITYILKLKTGYLLLWKSQILVGFKIGVQKKLQ